MLLEAIQKMRDYQSVPIIEANSKNSKQNGSTL